MNVAEYKKLLKQSKLEQTFLALCKVNRIDDPVCEYKFCETRRWRFDFAWLERKIAVEIEGGTWTGGRHTRGSGFAKDCEKYNHAALDGWRVFRFTDPVEAVDFLVKNLSLA